MGNLDMAPSQHQKRKEGISIGGRNSKRARFTQVLQPFSRDVNNRLIFGSMKDTKYNVPGDEESHPSGLLDRLFDQIFRYTWFTWGERERGKKLVGRVELFFLSHPGREEIFSGFGLTVEEGSKENPIGILMVNRPRSVDQEWLNRIKTIRAGASDLHTVL
jgi:hypothetical protein